MPHRARGWRVLVLGVIAAVGFARLGVWQLDRLHQRRVLRSAVEARRRQSPLELTDSAPAGVTPDSLNYRPVTAHGVFDFARQVVVLGRVLDEVPGVYLATPLRLADGRALLVERGWVASPDMQSVALDALTEPESASVGGVFLRVRAAGSFRPSEGTSWPLFAPTDDPERLAPRFPYPLLPWVLRRTESAPGMPAGLKPIRLPALDDGPHLWYAIQWFAFAMIAVVGSVALFLRKGGRGNGEG